MSLKNSAQRGKIHVENAYAQGKMWDGSGWNLPRNIKPSDIDMVFDDEEHNRILFCELVRIKDQPRTWNQLSNGQYRLHKSLVRVGSGRIYSALLSHVVSIDRQINTKTDIMFFQLMKFAPLLGHMTTKIFTGDDWPAFVYAWYRREDYRWQ